MTAGTSGRMTVRVTMGDTWTAVILETSADETVAAVKARVLAAAEIPADRASGYEVKVGGAAVRDERRTLEETGVRNGVSLVVLARRRRPVR